MKGKLLPGRREDQSGVAGGIFVTPMASFSPVGPIIAAFVFVLFSQGGKHHSRPSSLKIVPERLLFLVRGAFGKPFCNPMGVFFDSHHDEILIADTGNHRIVILDGTDGHPKAQFVRRLQRGGEVIFGEPRSVAQNSLGEIFIVDNLCDYVEVWDFQGTPTRQIRLKEYLPPTELAMRISALKPVAVTVDYKDNLYIATPRRIFVFDKDFRIKGRIGKEGNSPHDFMAITSLWVDTRGHIYVTDAQGYGVKVLSPDGQILLSFGAHESGLGNFSLPIGIVTDRRGYIWVADALRHIVSVFDGQGNFLDYIGAMGLQPGQFLYPSGISAHWGGKIVVLDRVGGRVQCFALPSPPRRVAGQ